MCIPAHHASMHTRTSPLHAHQDRLNARSPCSDVQKCMYTIYSICSAPTEKKRLFSASTFEKHTHTRQRETSFSSVSRARIHSHSPHCSHNLNVMINLFYSMEQPRGRHRMRRKTRYGNAKKMHGRNVPIALPRETERDSWKNGHPKIKSMNHKLGCASALFRNSEKYYGEMHPLNVRHTIFGN